MLTQAGFMNDEFPSTIVPLGWREARQAGSCMADGPEETRCPARKVFEAQLGRQGTVIRLCERHLYELAALARRSRQ